MKMFKNLLLATLLFTASVIHAQPQVTPRVSFGGSGTAVSTNVSYFVVPASGTGAPLVTYAQFSTDVAGGYLRTLVPLTTTNQTIVISNVTASTTVPLSNSDSWLAADDVLVFQLKATDSYTRRTVSSATTTNVVVNAAITLTKGDMCFQMSTNGAVSSVYVVAGISTNNVTANGGPVYVGRKAQPMLVEVYSPGATTNNYLRAVSGTYQPF